MNPEKQDQDLHSVYQRKQDPYHVIKERQHQDPHAASQDQGLVETQTKTQDPDWMTSQGNLVKTQLDQTQDTPSSYKTSISFGPSGLATHCIGMSCPFSPKSPATRLPKISTGPRMDWIWNWMVFIYYVISSSSWTHVKPIVIISWRSKFFPPY